MNRRWTHFFGQGIVEGDPERKDILGGKGASLAAMSKAGLPVPPGFTISTQCCRLYLDNHGQWPEGLEAEVREQLARLEEMTGRKYGARPPLLVSVRSGAAASMPGMMDTILNCGLDPAAASLTDVNFWRVYSQFALMFGKTVAGISPDDFETAGRELASGQKSARHRQHSEVDSRLLAERYLKLYTLRTDQAFPATPWEALTQCIEAVFRSWNNERAITYRREHDVRGCAGTAVTVQSMFPSEVSGIVFTMNPNNLEANEIIIESSYGLGEAVVSGDVHPDSFAVDRQTLEIRRRVIGHKAHMVTALGDQTTAHDPDAPSLADVQIQELARISMGIERFFGKPMDIEFGRAEGKFAMLQSRPIRGLDVLEDVEVGRKEEIYRLRELAGPHRRVWVTHNLGETLPAPTPLTWDIVSGFMSGNGGFGRMYRDLGYQPSPEVCREGFLELIAGRIYADPERAAMLFWSGMPLRYDLDAVVRDPKVMDAAPSLFDPTRADGRFLVSLPSLICRMLTCSRNMKALRKIVVERFEKEILPPYLEWVAAKRRQDLGKHSTVELLAELRERIDRVLNEFGGESLKPGFFGGLADASLKGTLTQLMGQEAGTQLALTLTQGLEGDTTIEQGIAISDAAHGRRSLESVVEAYGHRAVEEMELSKPRWREDSSYLKQIMAMCQSPSTRMPEELHRRNVQRREAAEKDLPATLRHWSGSCLFEDVMTDLTDAQRMLPYRESGKHYLMMGYETIRRVITELADRWNLGRDIFFLTLDDLTTYESRRAELTPVIASRKLRWQSARRLEMPAVVDSQHLDDLGLPKLYDGAKELSGDPIAAGVATGQARIVYDPQKADDLMTDYVLVCPSTDPGWTALFVHAKALIVERGGVLSHGAIVARDFGIPALVCPDATRRIPDRTMVRVDGNRGLITFVEGN
jgi:phosphohistidine swiveling domain-containing protein